MQLAYKWRAACVVALGLFMAILDNTIVSVALPQMQRAFHVSTYNDVLWVSTAYFLAQAAVIPITGYLSDRLGSKFVFLTALALFTVGSGLCALAPTFPALVTLRVIQGIGGGALFPVAFAITFRIFPPNERGPASALIGVPVLLAPAFGPTIGGFLTTKFDWSAIFLVNVPIGIVAFALGYFILLNRAADEAAYGGGGPSARKGFDILGFLLSMVGCTTLVYGISEAGNNGWGDATVDRFLIAGGLLIAAFIVVELRSQDPVIDVRLFTNYTFTVANVLTWAMGAFLFGSLFLLPLFFENVRGYTALSTGEIFISQGLAAAVGVVISGRLYNRLGPRFFVVLGMALITLGTYGMTRLGLTTTGGDLTLWLICRGLGLGLTNTSLQTVAVSSVSNRAMARASSLINVTRQMFAALGVAALSTYLAQQGKTHGTAMATAFQKTQAFTQASGQCAAQFGHVGRAAVGQCIQNAVVSHVTPLATTSALNDTFVVAMVGCGIAAALALFLGRDPALQAMKQGQGTSSATPESESGAPQPVLVGE